MNDPVLPRDREEYGEELTIAFMFGMSATVQAFNLGDDPDDRMKVMNVAKEVAAGRLTLASTGAEMRLKGLDIPADIHSASIRHEKTLARVVCHHFARVLFSHLGGNEGTEEDKR